ncbi:MAG: hypothetical protein HY079_11270 [Elusimicrobia bacterium]|nr:hypothetical protein [Elusimicrobiota bacterium]
MTMNAETIRNSLVILAGAAVMLVSIGRAGELKEAVAYVPEAHRRRVGLYLLAHRALMGVFVAGYLAVGALFATEHHDFSEGFVAAIFFLGAVFVLTGVVVQARLLAELQRTLHGIIPICMHCKLIRVAEAKPGDPESWKTIEAYIASRSNARFSHGYCPACYEREMKAIEAKEGKH